MAQQSAVALPLLGCLCLLYLLSIGGLHSRRNTQPIADRGVVFLLLPVSALLLCASAVLLLSLTTPLLLQAESEAALLLRLLALVLGTLSTSLLLLIRAVLLRCRLAPTAEEQQKQKEAASSGQQDQVLDLRSRAGSITSIRAEHSPGRRAAASTSLSPQQPRTAWEEGEAEHVRTAAEGGREAARSPAAAAASDSNGRRDIAWLRRLSHRWLVGSSLLGGCCFLTASLLPACCLLAALLPRSASEVAALCAASSPLSLSVRVACCLLAPLPLLFLLPAARSPRGADGLGTEVVLYAASALVLLPLSTALAEPAPAASAYLLLASFAASLSSHNLMPLLLSCIASQSLLSNSVDVAGVLELVRDDAGYASFLSFLRSEYSEENLLFWREVETLRQDAAELQRLDERRTRRLSASARKLTDEADGIDARQSVAKQQLHSASPVAPLAAADSPVLSLQQAPPSHRLRHQASTDYSSSSSSLSISRSQAEARLRSHRQTHSIDALVSWGSSSGRQQERAAAAAAAGRRARGSDGGAVRRSAGSEASAQLLHVVYPAISEDAAEQPALTAAVPAMSASSLLPATLDAAWDSAIARLRRISWSIVLERKAQRHRQSRTRGREKDSASAAAAPQAAARASLSAPAQALAQLRSVDAAASAISPPRPPPVVTAAASSPAAVPAASSPSSRPLATPFMQSIVRALQATKLTGGRRELREEEARRQEEERRQVLLRDVLQRCCLLYDRFIAAGSASQVNLPHGLVQTVHKRMKEICPGRYSGRRKRGGRGAAGGGAGGGMQATLGLMRHATLHFFAPQQLQAYGGRKDSALQSAKAEEEQQAAAAEAAASLVSDASLLSFPLHSLFSDCQQAIEQLMQSDSFKRYLASPAFASFCREHASRRRTAGTRAAVAGQGWTRSRQGSKSRSRAVTAAVSPRLSNRHEMAETEAEAERPLQPLSLSPAHRERGHSSSAALPVSVRSALKPSPRPLRLSASSNSNARQQQQAQSVPAVLSLSAASQSSAAAAGGAAEAHRPSLPLSSCSSSRLRLLTPRSLSSSPRALSPAHSAGQQELQPQLQPQPHASWQPQHSAALEL